MNMKKEVKKNINLKPSQKYCTKLDKKGEMLRWKDINALIEYARPHLKLFLDPELEDLIADGKGKEAYNLLLKSLPEVSVKRIQNKKATPIDELLMNAVEYHTLIVNGENLICKKGEMPEYFKFKAAALQNKDNMEYLEYEECLRLYYVGNQDELLEDIKEYIK